MFILPPSELGTDFESTVYQLSVNDLVLNCIRSLKINEFVFKYYKVGKCIFSTVHS